MWNETEKCNICGKKLLAVGMRNHIIGSAKGELYQWYFSQATKKPHLDFVSKNSNLETIVIKRIKLSK